MKNINLILVIFMSAMIFTACEKEENDFNKNNINQKNDKILSSEKSIVVPPTNDYILIDTLDFIIESVEDFNKLDTILDENQFIFSTPNNDFIVENADGSEPTFPEDEINFKCSYKTLSGHNQCISSAVNIANYNRAQGICFTLHDDDPYNGTIRVIEKPCERGF